MQSSFSDTSYNPADVLKRPIAISARHGGLRLSIGDADLPSTMERHLFYSAAIFLKIFSFFQQIESRPVQDRSKKRPFGSQLM
jgi:hypothetical protein